MYLYSIWGCSFYQSFCCIENLCHVQALSGVCNCDESSLRRQKMLPEVPMFLQNNQPLTTRQFHSNSKIFALLSLVCLFIDFSEYQFVPSRKAKILKDRRGESLRWPQNLFSFWKEQGDLQTPLAYRASALAGRQDQGLGARENCGAELATRFPFPKFPHGGCAWPSGT